MKKKDDAKMLGRIFAAAGLIAAIVLSGLAPVAAKTDARQHATQVPRTLVSRKAETAQINKSMHSQERTTTAQLNSSEAQLDPSQLNAPETRPSDRTIVSVGPQASAFQRIRDIAMAPTG
jgi:hypothetical protein